MNDFTKEELEYIWNYIFNGAASIRLDSHEQLKDKIKSMMDNYCEHGISGVTNDGQKFCDDTIVISGAPHGGGGTGK